MKKHLAALSIFMALALALSPALAIRPTAKPTATTAPSTGASSLLEEYLAQDEMETPRVIADIVSLCNEGNIFLTLPRKEYGSHRQEYYSSWDRYKIADDFEIIYSIYYDGSGDWVYLNLPVGYMPSMDIMTYTLQYMAGLSNEEANDLMAALIYNMLNNEITFEKGHCEINFTINSGSYTFSIRRYSAASSAAAESDINPILKPFTKNRDFIDSVSETVYQACRSIEHVMQAEGPYYIDFNADDQSVYCLIVCLYGEYDSPAENIRESVESATDAVMRVLSVTYPMIDFGFIDVEWTIPSIDPEARNAAKFRCRKYGGIYTRLDSDGTLYQ